MSEDIMTNISDKLHLFTCTDYTKVEKEEIISLGDKIMKKCSLVCLCDFVSVNI